MRVKIDLADKTFSQYIRLRDRSCARCGSLVELNNAGLPVSHQASHYYGRVREATRFDPENVDCLCYGCHKIWGSDDKEGYRQFKIKQLGQRNFDLLTLRAGQYQKKDRKLALIQAKLLLKSITKGT